MESSTMKEAYGEIQRLSDDVETRKAAIAREIHLMDQIQRELVAKEEGEELGKAEIAIKMHKEKIPIETITKLTDFTEKEILHIVKKNIK